MWEVQPVYPTSDRRLSTHFGMSRAEQRRIVVNVDHLVALVDQLETQLAASRATATNLLEALVAELTTKG